jgi:hypothetical protein
MDLVTVSLLSASLVGWGVLWGIEFAAAQALLRLRCLRLALAVLNPLAHVTGAVFWGLESIRARWQTEIANEEAGE